MHDSKNNDEIPKLLSLYNGLNKLPQALGSVWIQLKTKN